MVEQVGLRPTWHTVGYFGQLAIRCFVCTV